MTPQHPAAPETETDANGWVADLTEAHRDSYPMGNIHHGTPENPDWGTFCVECKESWPCDVSRLLERVRVVEGERDAEVAEVEREHEKTLAIMEAACDRADLAAARAESAEAAHEAEKAAHERLRAGIWALGESIHGDEGVEHVEGCEGEPTCFACILDTLRSLLGGGEAR